MRYNLFISDANSRYNILDIAEEQLKKVINAYLNGDSSVTLSGKKYYLTNVDDFKIFTFEPKTSPQEELKYYLNNSSFRVKNAYESYLPKSTLVQMGKNVTYEKIGDSEFGENSSKSKEVVKRKEFIAETRIEELRKLKSDTLDLTRLIKLCDELNDNFQLGNYMTVAMIGRTILDHIPPIFNFEKFDQITNNYNTKNENKSFKKIMIHLNTTLRNIANKYLHQTIRKSETLPTENQINFSQDFDVLLEEIVRSLKK